MATRRWRGAGDESAAGGGTRDRPRRVDPAHAGDGVGDGAPCFALARTARRTQLEAPVIRRTKLRKIHALPRRRGFLAMLAARLMPGVPATGLHYVAGVAPVGVPALAAILIAGASIAVGAVTAAVLCAHPNAVAAT